MAAGTVIYGISGDAVLRIRNTHGDSTSRPVAGPVIYGIFGDAVFEIGDAHEDSTPRTAKRQTLSRNRSLARRFCRVLSVRRGARSSVSRAARRFCPAGPQNRGTSESRVAQFACGTPVLAPRSVKTRHNGGPEAPGGPPATHRSKNRKKAPPKCTPESGFGGKSPCRRSAVAGPPPRRPAALRPTVESAYRTQSGRPGFHTCRAFTVRRPRIGVPEGIAFAESQNRSVAQHQ